MLFRISFGFSIYFCFQSLLVCVCQNVFNGPKECVHFQMAKSKHHLRCLENCSNEHSEKNVARCILNKNIKCLNWMEKDYSFVEIIISKSRQRFQSHQANGIPKQYSISFNLFFGFCNTKITSLNYLLTLANNVCFFSYECRKYAHHTLEWVAYFPASSCSWCVYIFCTQTITECSKAVIKVNAHTFYVK